MTTEVFETIRTKSAVRQFTDEPIPDDVVHEILDAGRLSGSSKNTQPWHFVAVRDRDVLQALAEAGTYAGHLAGAALGVVIVESDDPPSGTPDFDFGRATQNMMLAAWAHGIGSVMAYFHQAEKAAEALDLPDGYKARWGISFGHPADEQLVPSVVSGGRRPFDDVVHWDRW